MPLGQLDACTDPEMKQKLVAGKYGKLIYAMLPRSHPG
jgi:hypothetical protein